MFSFKPYVLTITSPFGTYSWTTWTLHGARWLVSQYSYGTAPDGGEDGRTYRWRTGSFFWSATIKRRGERNAEDASPAEPTASRAA